MSNQTELVSTPPHNQINYTRPITRFQGDWLISENNISSLPVGSAVTLHRNVTEGYVPAPNVGIMNVIWDITREIIATECMSRKYNCKLIQLTEALRTCLHTTQLMQHMHTALWGICFHFHALLSLVLLSFFLFLFFKVLFYYHSSIFAQVF